MGMVLGIIFGIIVGEDAKYARPIGEVFLRAIQMIIIPLILCAIVSGITSVADPSSLGRVGVKSILVYLSTTTFAILIGIALSVILQPGVETSLDLSLTQSATVDNSYSENFSVVKMLVNIVPSNIFDSLTKANLLQVVFFAMFTGVTLNYMKKNHASKQAEAIIDLFQSFSKLIFTMISIIMNLAPYAAFALTAWVVGTQGIEVLYSLGKLLGVMMIGMIVQYGIFGVFIFVFAKLSPIPFYKKSFEYQVMALSTSSSKATLPTTMQVCEERMGISNDSTSFVLPLGASMNMDGMAIYLGCAAVFFAQAFGVDLQLHDYFIIMLTATIGSIGGAGVPGSSMVMLPMVLASVNVPIEGVALIAGIDRLGDMVRTTINITGDAMVTLLIDKSENKLDIKKYYQDN